MTTTITLTYDSNNSMAQKAMEQLLSLGMFKISKTSTKKKVATRKKTFEFDNPLTPEHEARLEAIREEMRRGECVVCHSHEELDNFLAAL